MNGPVFVEFEYLEAGEVIGTGTGPHKDLDAAVRFVAKVAQTMIETYAGRYLRAVTFREGE